MKRGTRQRLGTPETRRKPTPSIYTKTKAIKRRHSLDTSDWWKAIEAVRRGKLVSNIEVHFHCGEQRRFFCIGRISEVSLKKFVAVPCSIREIGGGPELLRGRPERNQPIEEISDCLVGAESCLFRWASAFVELNAPLRR